MSLAGTTARRVDSGQRPRRRTEVTIASLPASSKEAVVTLTELTHPGLAAQDWRWVQWELFVFHDVRQVLPSGQPDTVLVAHCGPARTDEWVAALVAAELLDAHPASEPTASATICPQARSCSDSHRTGR